MSQLFDRFKSKLGHTNTAVINENTLKETHQKESASQAESSVVATASETQTEDSPELQPEAIQRQFYQSIFNCSINISGLSTQRMQALDALAEQFLNDAEFRVKSTPRLPAVVPQLLRCLNDKKSSNDDFVKLIKQDPSIAAAVLKTANSAFFNPNNKVIDSFQRAVVILGTQGLRSLLCTTMLQPITSDKKSGKCNFGKFLWAHSLRTGISSQLIAATQRGDPFLGYLAGLFNNIGDITLFSQLSSWDFSDESEMASGFYYLQQKCAKPLSAAIIQQWEIPGDIAAVVMGDSENNMVHVLQQAITFSQAIHLLQAEAITGEQLGILMDLNSIRPEVCGKVIEMTAQMQAG
ncbi:MAG: HDOD domain-containing protein [Pseudomonadales bacterium]|nr:HDOD domain-containing protein [Pseudomonadales bacterium]